MPRITDIFACVATAPDGDEVLLVHDAPGRHGAPLVTGNPDRIAMIREVGERVSREVSLRHRLLRYSAVEDVAAAALRGVPETPGPRRIEELWVFIAAEGPEDEGIMASDMGGPVIVPLVGADPARAASYVGVAEEISRATGRPHRIVRFKLVGEATRRF